MVDLGAIPSLERGSMLMGGDSVAHEYERVTKEVKEASLRKLLLRLRDNEIYHTEVFRDLLKEEEER